MKLRSRPRPPLPLDLCPRSTPYPRTLRGSTKPHSLTVHGQPSFCHTAPQARAPRLSPAHIVACILGPHRRKMQHGPGAQHLRHGRGIRGGSLRESPPPAATGHRPQIGLHLRVTAAGPGYPWERVPTPGTAERGVFPHVHRHGLRLCLKNGSNWRRERRGHVAEAECTLRLGISLSETFPMARV
jgi:hypothetical protein